MILNDFNFSDGTMVAVDYAKYLRQQNYEVYTLAPSGGEMSGAFKSLGCNCIADPTIQTDSRASYNLARQVDLVVVFSSGAFNSVYGAKGAGKPVLFFIQEHNDLAANAARGNFLFRKALQLADRVIYSSDYTKQRVEIFAKTKAPLVIKTGVEGIDRSIFGPVTKDIIKVVMLGNIEPRKNQSQVIQSLKNVDGIELTIIGKVTNTQYAGVIQSALKDATNINISQPTSEKETLDLIHKASVYLIASSDEAHSNGIPEALALGTPVCVSSVGALPEFVNEKVATRFNVNNFKTLEPAIREAAKLQVSDCIEHAKSTFSSKTQFTQYDDITEELKRKYIIL